MTRVRLPGEAFVAWLWSHQTGSKLVTTDGRGLRVIYPGRRYGGFGPDFHGAIIALDNHLHQGDIEVHVRGVDWRRHGHATDPAYGSTILHVVFVQGAAPIAMRPDGSAIPTVELGRVLTPPQVEALEQRWAEEASRPPDPIACLSGEEAAERLDRAGLAWFRSKVDRFEADLTCVSPEQALWRGLLEALGYSANTAPFKALAERVSAEEAAQLCAEHGPLVLEAILMGESGLLRSQQGSSSAFWPGDDGYTAAIESAWAASRRAGPRPAPGWRWLGVRPGNSPVRRVAAAAEIVRAPGLGAIERHMAGALAEVPPRRAALGLDRLLTVRGNAYWVSHRDFGLPLSRPLALVGRQRAADAVVNIVLPWTAAIGRTRGSGWPEGAAEQVFRAHGPLAWNQVTRHMARQILGAAPGVRLNAQRQQGLLHIYHGWCDARDCAHCPAGPARTLRLLVPEIV